MSNANRFFLLFLLCFVGACKSDPQQVERPDELISKSTPTLPPSHSVEPITPLPEIASSLTTGSECEVDSETGYWNGGDFGAQAVVSRTCDISIEAHETFRACGLRDEHIVEIINQDMSGPRDLPGNEATIVLSRREAPDATPTWTRVYSAQALAAGVYLVECRSLN